MYSWLFGWKYRGKERGIVFGLVLREEYLLVVVNIRSFRSYKILFDL